MMKDEILCVENLVTNQSAGQNLEYVSLTLHVGEILGITGLGESGISMLADVLTGVLHPSEGRIYFAGERVLYDTEKKARNLGIYGITYEKSVISSMSVSENLNVLRGGPRRNVIIRRRANLEITQAIFQQYGICGNVRGKASAMTVGQNMELSICRALLCGARVLVCREAGEGLSGIELQEFVQFLHQIRDEGVSVIMVNSDIGKTLQCADRVAVMRSGMICYTRKTSDTTAEEIHQRLLLTPSRTLGTLPQQEQRLQLIFRALRPVGEKRNAIDAELLTGSVLGVVCRASGRMDTYSRLFSGVEKAAGTVVTDEKTVSFNAWRRKNGKDICCLGSRFWEKGLYENMTAAENIVFRSIGRFDASLGVINRRMLRLALREFVKDHGIEMDELYRHPRHLSAEYRNQIVLWRALFAPPRILVLDHPLYTIDEKIKGDLLRCIEELKAQGTSILWISNDLPSLQAFCDYIVWEQDKAAT